jgi:hypothetical protein
MAAVGVSVTLLIGASVPIPAPSFLTSAWQSIQVTNTDEGRDGVQITFRVGRGGGLSNNLLDYQIVNSALLKPFNRVIIILSFGGIQQILIDGMITHQQLNPSNDPGQSNFTITGEDLSVMMDIEERSDTHPNQSDADIVKKIIRRYARYGLVPIVKFPRIMENPKEKDRVPSQQSTDLSYILYLAKLYDHVFYIEPTGMPGVNNAFWGPLDLAGPPQNVLSVNMGPATNVTSINFQYYALEPNTIVGTVKTPFTGKLLPVSVSRSLRPPLSEDPALLNQTTVRSKQFRESGLSEIQAKAVSQSQLDRSMNVVTVSGELNVLRYGNILRARRRVTLRGAGLTYDGLYYVKSVTHTIRRGDYSQSFSLTREGLGSSIQKVSI